MAPKRGDTGILIGATAAILAIGLVIAGGFMVATRGTKISLPNRQLALGTVSTMRDTVKSGDPNYFSDPTGAGTGFYLDREGDKFSAYVVTLPGTKDCGIRWAGSKKTYIDCHHKHVSKTQLAQYRTLEPKSGTFKGYLVVDLRRQIPPPSRPTSITPSPTGSSS
jgi:hypothetical protein